MAFNCDGEIIRSDTFDDICGISAEESRYDIYVLNGALRDMEQLHSGICEIDPLY